jgi:hypothetical protein
MAGKGSIRHGEPRFLSRKGNQYSPAQRAGSLKPPIIPPHNPVVEGTPKPPAVNPSNHSPIGTPLPPSGSPGCNNTGYPAQTCPLQAGAPDITSDGDNGPSNSTVIIISNLGDGNSQPQAEDNVNNDFSTNMGFSASNQNLLYGGTTANNDFSGFPNLLSDPNTGS